MRVYLKGLALEDPRVTAEVRVLPCWKFISLSEIIEVGQDIEHRRKDRAVHSGGCGRVSGEQAFSNIMFEFAGLFFVAILAPL